MYRFTLFSLFFLITGACLLVAMSQRPVALLLWLFLQGALILVATAVALFRDRRATRRATQGQRLEWKTWPRRGYSPYRQGDRAAADDEEQ